MNNEQHPQAQHVRDQFEQELLRDAAGGVQVDKKQNTINMCSQMPNVDFWIKEAAANASDAGASRFRVYGIESDTLHTIICEDNGHGMDRDGITNYFTVYRSRKKADVMSNRPIHGTHGLGKLTVAKIPNQTGYKVITSTGSETWLATTGSLINCDPIEIVRQKTAPFSGTRIEVTFQESL